MCEPVAAIVQGHLGETAGDRTQRPDDRSPSTVSDRLSHWAVSPRENAFHTQSRAAGSGWLSGEVMRSLPQ